MSERFTITIGFWALLALCLAAFIFGVTGCTSQQAGDFWRAPVGTTQPATQATTGITNGDAIIAVGSAAAGPWAPIIAPAVAIAAIILHNLDSRRRQKKLTQKLTASK